MGNEITNIAIITARGGSKRIPKKNILDFCGREAYDLLISEQCNAVFPVVQYSFPPQRGLYIANGFTIPVSPKDYTKRSQDLTPIYHDCGQFYFFRTESFRKTGSVVDGARPIVVNETEVQDIDTLTDWKLAEMKYLMRGQNDLT